MIRVDSDGLIYYQPPRELTGKGLVWAAFGRSGGASVGAFASLNAGYHVGDDSNRVTANRLLMANALSFPLDHLVAAQQVHGSGVVVVDQSFRGRGAENWESALPQTDALVTIARETYLLMVVADCAVLTLYDPIRQIIGTAHCGWKGMVAKLGQKTVGVMTQTFGCDPRDLALIVSPSIGPCCYEVGDLVLEPLKAAYPSWQSFVREYNGKTHLDLWAMASRQALDSGLQAEKIHIAGLCTACHTALFYSHRAEKGNTGRFAVVAGLR